MGSSFKFLMFLLVLPSVIISQVVSSYILGVNLVENYNFQNPLLIQGLLPQFYPLSIQSWNCKYFCKLIYVPSYCTFYQIPCATSNNQVIDMDSYNNQVLKQTLILPNAGIYQFSFQWIPPAKYGVGRFLQVYLNQTLITNITISLVNSKTNYPYNYTNFLNITTTQVYLSFKMGGSVTGFGIMLDNVSFREVISNNATSNNSNTTTNQSNQLNMSQSFFVINNTYTENYQDPDTAEMSMANSLVIMLFFNKLMQNLNSVPGARVFFSVFLNCLTHFDRLQLYYHHNQRFTQNSQQFLQMINQLQSQKGSLLQILLNIGKQKATNTDSIYQKILQTQDKIVSMLNYKQNYSDIDMKKVGNRGSFFYANNFDFFYYSIAGTIAFHLLFYLLFRLSSDYRISKIFRKYCFIAVLYLELVEGNLQQFTFYYFQDLGQLFSFNFYQKLSTVFLVYFYLLISIFTIGGILFLSYWYRKYVKYFIQQTKKKMLSLFYLTFEVGIMPIAFGMAHSLLLHNMFLQTIVLASLQVLFTIVYIYYLNQDNFSFKTVIFTKIIANILRVCFNVTFYFHDNFDQEDLINEIHSVLIILYAICMVMEVVIGLISSVLELYKIIKKNCNQSKKQQIIIIIKKSFQKENTVLNLNTRSLKRKSKFLRTVQKNTKLLMPSFNKSQKKRTSEQNPKRSSFFQLKKVSRISNNADFHDKVGMQVELIKNIFQGPRLQ